MPRLIVRSVVGHNDRLHDATIDHAIDPCTQRLIYDRPRVPQLIACTRPHHECSHDRSQHATIDPTIGRRPSRLQTAQNKMIRYLLNYGCRRHIGFSDFKKSNCLDINARVDYMSLNLMFNIFNNVAPSYMCDINRISHRHNTRQSDSAFVVPGVKGQGSKSSRITPV